MSYDVILETPECSCPKCGRAHGGDRLFSANYTSNTSCMWRAAGVDLAEWAYDKAHGPASGLGAKLADAISVMEADPGRFRAMNSDNGWGNYDGTMRFLKSILAACREHPNAVVYVSN